MTDKLTETVERMTAAIDADLARQASVQRGVEYHKADECGVASANMNIVVSELARAAIASLPTSPVQTNGGASEPSPLSERTFRHVKRGTVYTLIGVGRAQGTLNDEDPVVLYRGEDGGLWARHQAEFSDGRFEDVIPGSAADGGSDALGETVAKLREQLNDSSPRTGEDWPDYCYRVRPLMAQAATLLTALEQRQDGRPIPMILHCPACGLQHIDAPDERTPDWTNPPHRSHLCHGCGCIWRPAEVATEGVRTITTAGKADTWPPSAPLPTQSKED